MFDNVLDGDDGVCSVRDDATGRDRHRFASGQRARRRHARRDARDDREPARRVRGTHREPIHRRARKRRQVDNRTRVLRQHTPEGPSDRDRLTVERLRPLEHARLRLGEREQLGHREERSAAVTSEP
jgi:hypothetical protein